MIMNTYKRNGKAGKASQSTYTHTGRKRALCSSSRIWKMFASKLRCIVGSHTGEAGAKRNALLIRLINNLNLNLINNLVSSRKDAKLAVHWGACLVKFAWQATNEIKQS